MGRRRLKAAIFALLGGVTVYGVTAWRSPSPTPAASAATARVPPQTVAQGRAVYNFRCYFCHGYSGDAKTLAATFMTPAPRNFVAASPDTLSLETIRRAVQEGSANTGMKPFKGVISEADIDAVSTFVFDEFVVRKAKNTRYHTPENGWENHQKYAAAFPFATGEISLDTDWAELSAQQQAGKRLFLGSCVTCHDRGRPDGTGIIWESRPLSYPRNNYDHRQPEIDAATSATPYRLHDRKPQLVAASPAARRGEKLFQENCAFCHAADGTGKNWIGSFLEPHPRNLTDPAFMGRVTRPHLRQVIMNGLPETSMPAWKSVLSAKQIEDLISYIDTAFHRVGS